MSSSLGKLNIHLSLEAAKFQQTPENSNQNTQRFVRQFQVNFSNAQQKAKQFSEKTTRYLNNIEQAAKNINSTMKLEFRLGGLSQVINAAKQFTMIADSYTELKNRITLVTNSQHEQVAAMENIYAISMKTNQALGATTQVYQRFAQNAEKLNLSQYQIAELTETVSKAVAMSGASASSAEAVLM